jgi:hypothetical protein
VDPVTCPSCGSEYNPETRELVRDTGLQARIRELEGEAETLRNASVDLQRTLDQANARLAIFDAPKPKAPDFIVGKI